jgi:hypothetical protein
MTRRARTVDYLESAHRRARRDRDRAAAEARTKKPAHKQQHSKPEGAARA